MYIYYGIVKTYKGILKKKFSDNVHLLVTPSKNNFSIFIILGKLKNKNDSYALQLIGSGPIEFVKNVLHDYGIEEKGFILVEKLSCSVNEKDGNEFFKIDKKGKYILSDFELEFQPDFSSGNSKMFFLKGKLNPVVNEELSNNTQMKMSAMKKTSILDSIKNMFKGKN